MTRNLLLVAILATITLSGCATTGGPGIYNGLGEDPWVMFSPGRGDGKPLEPEQCALLDTIAQEEWAEVKLELSSPFEAAALNALPYGLAGAAGGGIIDRLTAIGGGLTGFVAGAFGGLQVWSYSAVWQLSERMYHRITYLKSVDDPRAKTLYIIAAFVRAKNVQCKNLLTVFSK